MRWRNQDQWRSQSAWRDEKVEDQPRGCVPDMNEMSHGHTWRLGDDWSSDMRWHHTPPDWIANRPRKRRFLFLRFLFFFIPMLVTLVVVMSLLLNQVYRPLQDMIPHTGILMIVVVGIPLVIGLVAFIFGGLAFRRFGSPMADIMAALDAVANGDLRVRVNENSHGEFLQMQRSFNRMAEELSRAETNRRNMTADVVHELRTPLHIIQGNLEGLLDGVYEPTKEQISATLDETRLLARLVADLQTLSLAEAGKLYLHKELISAGDLIEDAVTSFSGLAAENGITLTTEITGSTDMLMISADPDRLSQVLNNLVANAVRYTPTGGKITLKVNGEKSGVRIAVEDTGSGIAEEDLPFVFDRFWKADQSRSRHEGTGSGLGLAIARQLVQAHGGNITVESKIGQGTRFIIQIPAGADGG